MFKERVAVKDLYSETNSQTVQALAAAVIAGGIGQQGVYIEVEGMVVAQYRYES